MDTPPPRRRKSLTILAAMLGAMCGLGGVLLFWLIAQRDPLPPLTPRDFADAQARWLAHGPRNYDIEIAVEGRQPAAYRVEVRNGEAAAALRNGQPLTQRRTWSTWSVPGMFGTLESDFDHVARLAAGTADANTPRLSLYGAFDSAYGYPRRYRRIMLGQGQETSMAHRIGQGAAAGNDSSAMEVQWTVREFTPRQ